MKIQCNVCELAEATLLCCADDAALCSQCDEQVHAANKLAGKHERVPLIVTSQVPACDICQEGAGYFFCLEDRALLCRGCDVATHTTSPFVSSHRRFLITGVRVGLPNYDDEKGKFSSSNGKFNTGESRSSTLMVANSSVCDDKFSSGSARVTGGESEEYRPQWPWNELFDVAEFNQSYEFSEPGSSN